MRALVTAALIAFASTAHADAPLEPYPLDGLPRSVETTGPMRCPAFALRLAELEAIVAKVARKANGRAPKAITHLGSFNCRPIRRYPDLTKSTARGRARWRRGCPCAG